MARRKSDARTTRPVEYRIPGRSWNVYVVPPPVGVGIATAKSGTMVEPAGPPTFSKATSPSFVMVTTDQLCGRYARAGSRESNVVVDSTEIVPPRCPRPEPVAMTHSADP